jgi:hypothetical protein
MRLVAQRKQRMRERRRSMGLCGACGGKYLAGMYNNCSLCRDKDARRMQQYRISCRGC